MEIVAREKNHGACQQMCGLGKKFVFEDQFSLLH